MVLHYGSEERLSSALENGRAILLATPVGEATTTQTQQTTPPVAQPRVRVYEREGRIVVDCGGAEAPTPMQVWERLSASNRRVLGRREYSSLNTWAQRYATNGGDLSDLSQAISQAIAHRDQARNEGFHSGIDANQVAHRLTAGAPAYMAVGGTLFRMQPAGEVETTRALTTLRRQQAAAIRQERDGLVANANREAEAIIQEAQRRETAARQLQEEARRSNRLVVPQWYRGDMKKDDSGRLHLKTTLAFYLRFWHMNYGTGVLTWEFPANPPVSVYVWVPIRADGSFSWEHLYLDQATTGDLPHLTHNSSCLNPGESLSHIDSAEAWERFRLLLQRTLNTVNMDSLLQRDPSHWHEYVLYAPNARDYPVQKKLIKFIKQYYCGLQREGEERIDPTTISTPQRVSQRREAEAIWTA
jgi:hypothetical protein